MSGEYIYKNAKDNVRVKIFERYTSLGREWDMDVFFKDRDDDYTFSIEEGDLFPRKKDAYDEMTKRFGQMKSINPKDTVTEGWK